MTRSGSSGMFCLFGVEAIGTEPRVVDLDEPSLLLSCQAGQHCAAEQLLELCSHVTDALMAAGAGMAGEHGERLLVQARLRSSCEC